jgi:hypothetical protein
MTSSYRAMPTIASDTIVRHSQNYPKQYHLGTGKWSQIMGNVAMMVTTWQTVAIVGSFTTSIAAAICEIVCI